MIDLYDNLEEAIHEGLSGKNEGLPTGFRRLDDYISLKKKMMISVIGSPGSGKSAITNYAFLLNPLDHAIKKNKDVKIILFSMERSIIFTVAKWMCAKIFEETGCDIDLKTLLGWSKNKMTEEQLAYVKMNKDYFKTLQERLVIYEGQRSPSDIFRIVKTFSEERGKEKNITEFKKQYIPNNPEEHIIVIVDHLGLTKTNKEYPTKKQAIDRVVEHLQYFRDYLNYTVVPVSQLNRDLSNPIYKKLESFEPHLDNIKETGNIGEASDVVISLFDPLRYGTTDKMYGDVEIFRSPTTGNKYFRSLSILKNSYGTDGVSIGTVFMGQNGLFRELMKAKEFKNLPEDQQDTYIQNIFNHNIFLKQ
jgi:replicative DNA helicase